MNSGFEGAFRAMLKSVALEVLAEPRTELQSPVSTSQDENDSAALQLLRPKEAAEELAISEKQLWKLTKAGKLPSVRINRSVRYDMAMLRQWITLPDASRKVGEPPADGHPVKPKLDRQAKPRKAASTQKPSRVVNRDRRDVRRTKKTKAAPTKTDRSGQACDSASPRSIRAFIAKRLGVSPEKLPRLTNGRIRAIAGVDIPTLHGWAYFNRDLPETATTALEQFYAGQLEGT